MKTLLILMAVVCAGSAFPTMVGNQPMVTVEQGDVYGLAETYDGVNVYAFRAIPFAEPPVDELRFQPPVPAGPFGTLNATENPKQCVQIVATGRENCLYLNVYIPEVNETQEPLAVMVWIHGGAFFAGDITQYDRTDKLIQNDVIVVSVQYRLGILGFFSTGDDVAPGNYGLMDQTLGIQWVKNNIEQFGGDSNRITIFGQSAGAASVHMQILTPYSTGLFNQAIAISGNGLCPWGVGREWQRVSVELAERFNCSTVPEEMVPCLRGINAQRLNSAVISFAEWNFQPFFFGPRVDGDYIPDEPAVLVRDGLYNQVPLMTGATRDEMALETGELFGSQRVLDSFNEDFETNGPISLFLYDDEEPLTTATDAYNYYVGSTFLEKDDVNEVTLMDTERLFHMPLDWLVKYQTRHSDVYMYQFNYRGSVGLMDLYVSLGFNVSEDAYQYIGHGDDLSYIFGLTEDGALNSTDDLVMLDIMPKVYTNFVKTGTPTPDDSLLGFVWPLADWEDLQIAELVPTPTLLSDSRAVNRAFWESLPLRINSHINQD